MYVPSSVHKNSNSFFSRGASVIHMGKRSARDGALRAIFWATFFLCLFLLALPLMAAPALTESKYYYDVSGLTEQAIREDMNAQRRRHVRGGYDAYVSWSLAWHFHYDDDLKGCKIVRASTSLKVDYQLPRWVDEAAANAPLRQRWNAYYDALLEHEYGHRDFGIAAAEAVASALLAMPHYRDCLVLRRNANELAARVLWGYLVREKDYDRETRHGMTQGAVFP